MTDPIGPMWVGGFEEITVSDAGIDYVLQFLPDKHNEALQSEGKNPVFYWLPNAMRLAKKPSGVFKLSFLHFVGTQDGNTNIGVAPGQTREASGGVLSFAMTGAPPDGVLAQAHQAILDRMKERNDVAPFWRVLANFAQSSEADIRPVPIRQSTLRIMLTDQDGALEGLNPGDPFFVNAQGQGPGGLSPLAEHPFIVNLGTLAAAQVEQGLLSVQTPIAVDTDMTLAMWAPITSLHMESNWERVFTHWGVQASAQYFWSAADVKAAFNNLRMSGDIKISLKMDKSIPGADNQEEMVTKYIDMLVSMWLEQAKQVIFQPMPDVQDPAPRSGGLTSIFGWGFGGGVSLNYRQDRTEIANTFQFDIDQMYAQPHTMGGAVDGIAEAIAADPAQKSNYMRTLYLDNWERKITTVCRPVVNWPDPERGWVGDPVKFVSVQIGYPDVDGKIAWSAHDFTAPKAPTEVPDTGVRGDGQAVGATTPQTPASSATLIYATGTTAEMFMARQTQKKSADVTAPPESWAPDKVFVRRTVHFDEPPSEAENPFVKVFIDANDVELDPGDHGTVTDKLDIPVRADHVGCLALGPMRLALMLTAETDIVEVEFNVTGTLNGQQTPPRAPIRFSFRAKDQAQDRYLAIYTGQVGWLPEYTYKTRFIRMGTIDEAGQEWTGPPVPGEGNGALNLRVARKSDPGVTVIAT